MPEYFIEQALTISECKRKIREKYGDGAQIMMQKSIRMGGIFGLFARDGVELTGIIPQARAEGIGLYANAAGNRYYGASPVSLPGSPGENILPARKPLDFEEEKKKVIAAANPNKDTDIQIVLSEVRNLHKKLDASAAAAKTDEHPTIVKIEDTLVLNDFSPSYRQNILERIRKEFSLEALEDFDTVQQKVVEWIGESIGIYREERFQRRPRIMVLVGPTGVGKTTTVAKLAASFKLGNNKQPPREVRLITIDGFRIGAEEQITKLAHYMDVPINYADNYDQLKKIIAVNSDGVDMILIDTIGKSPRDSASLGEMKQFLDACGSFAEIHLTVAAPTKTSDLEEIFRQFEPFNYQSVIITKMDETVRVGNVVSVLAERGKKVSYIADGQKVPADIQKAAVIQFLLNLEGFRINRGKIDKLFPQDGSEKNQWR
ncbi:flagellar biosynthesis protein FlhF [Spirochaetia bacterium]|nr:flagellar biosynthesis protein FlhF [Spirochaetia bacterium]